VSSSGRSWRLGGSWRWCPCSPSLAWCSGAVGGPAGARVGGALEGRLWEQALCAGAASTSVAPGTVRGTVCWRVRSDWVIELSMRSSFAPSTPPSTRCRPVCGGRRGHAGARAQRIRGPSAALRANYRPLLQQATEVAADVWPAHRCDARQLARGMRAMLKSRKEGLPGGASRSALALVGIVCSASSGRRSGLRCASSSAAARVAAASRPRAAWGSLGGAGGWRRSAICGAKRLGGSGQELVFGTQRTQLRETRIQFAPHPRQ
jgi:hypothetical protein